MDGTNGSVVVSAVRKILSFEMTIAEWIGTALILAAPYVVIGIGWTAFNLDQLDGRGLVWLIQLIGSIVFWPALVFSAVCVA
ncbi:hypothetical protein [Mycolicibacterium sp. GF69]|uniref:hypothetical protein n=1 Tax=Mycolicibacterium sp. GF69 TaxID=2267251 RepID=UPI0014022E72|nr:hypothetical protein [Mycolicibacterium sp. GF69]